MNIGKVVDDVVSVIIINFGFFGLLINNSIFELSVIDFGWSLIYW